ADSFETARLIAAELKSGTWDLILFGRMAIDDYNHQVGVIVAELLGLPCVSAVSHLDIEGVKGIAEREIEGGIEVVEFPLPALLTVDKGLNEPRYPALKGIMAAKKKPPEGKAGKIVGEGAGAVAELVRLLREEAKVL